MSRETADAFWGREAVELALAEAQPGDVTPELLDEVATHADPPGAFRAWALAQPWPRFCAIVRIVAGAVRKEVEEDGEG
jgi:hypothetical protein